MYVLGPCGSLQQTLLGGWEFLPLMQPPQFFTVRGFEALFPHTRTLSCVVCLATQLFLLVYLDMNVGPLALPAEALPGSSPPQLPVFTSPTGLDECFFFNSLIVGLPYSSIFCQFWLVFVFKFVVILLLVVRGTKAYLCLHLGQKSLKS